MYYFNYIIHIKFKIKKHLRLDKRITLGIHLKENQRRKNKRKEESGKKI